MEQILVKPEAGTVTFAAAYEEHSAYLLRVAYLLTNSAAAAEDAVHDVFVRCAARLADMEHVRAYLRTSVVNECRTQHRRNQRVDATAEWLEGEEDLPYEILQTRRALATLNQRQRTAVVLRYFVDIPDKEIAKVLDCAPGTVRSILHRALKQLEEELR